MAPTQAGRGIGQLTGFAINQRRGYLPLVQRTAPSRNDDRRCRLSGCVDLQARQTAFAEALMLNDLDILTMRTDSVLDAA